MVAALRSPSGASAELIARIERGEVAMMLSVALALECEAICSRPEHRAVTRLTAQQAGAVVDAMIGLSEPLRIRYRLRPQLRDGGEEMVLETAVNGRADASVTFNVRHFGNVAAQYGIDVLRPGEALRKLRQ